MAASIVLAMLLVVVVWFWLDRHWSMHFFSWSGNIADWSGLVLVGLALECAVSAESSCSNQQHHCADNVLVQWLEKMEASSNNLQ